MKIQRYSTVFILSVLAAVDAHAEVMKSDPEANKQASKQKLAPTSAYPAK